jgi:hypothetical protein
MPIKISIRWALIAGFLGLIWGTHLITTTSAYLTSQEVLRQHACDIMIQALKEKGRLNDHEVVFQDKDGRLKHCSLNAKILRTRSGRPYRIIGSLRDINDRKMAEQELLCYKKKRSVESTRCCWI